MSDHPSIERLEEYVYGQLSDPETGAVEQHLPGCRDCAFEVQRRIIESARLSRAMSKTPPKRLVARILETAPARPRVAWLPLAAAAALCAGLIGVVVWQRQTKEGTIRRLEEQVASLSAWRDKEQDSASRIPESLFQMGMEGSVDEIMAWAKIGDGSEDRVRSTLLAAASTTADVLARAARGEIETSELATMDTLGGIEGELRATLEESEYTAFVERLDRRSREAAEHAAREFMDNLGASVEITSDERAQLTSYLIERTAWRRDETILPDFVRQHLCASLLREGKALSTEARKRVPPEQAGKVLAFLDRAEGRYRTMWSRMSQR
jgi:hypothetical protein